MELLINGTIVLFLRSKCESNSASQTFIRNMKRASLQASHRRAADLKAFINEISVSLSIANAGLDSTNLTDLLQRIAGGIAVGAEADRVAIITFDLERKKTDHFIRAGKGAKMINTSVPFDELMSGLSGWVINNCKSAISPKYIPDSRESAEAQKRRIDTNCGSIIVSPLMHREQILGTVTVINGLIDRDFDNLDLQIIESAASQAASTIIKFKLYEELERTNQELKVRTADLEKEIAEKKRVEELLRQSENNLRQRMEYAPDGLIITDSEGSIIFVNQKCEKLFGYRRDELINQSIELLIPPDSRSAHIAFRKKYYENPTERPMGSPITKQLFGLRKSGKKFPVEVSLSPLHAPTGLSVIASIRDISERLKKEEEIVNRAEQLTVLHELGRSIASTFDLEEIYAQTFRSAKKLMPLDVFLISLCDENEQKIRDVFVYDSGVRYPNEVISLSEPSIMRHVLDSNHTLLIEDDLYDEPVYQAKTIFGKPEDTRSVIMVPLLDQGQPIGIISTQHYQPHKYNSSHVQTLELLASQVSIAILNAHLHEELKQEAIRAPLTGLFNRRFMEETLSKEFQRAARKRKSLAFALIDIDHFKSVNDEFGHDAGDHVLDTFGKLLEQSIRKGDIACRIGGEEFALIMMDVPLKIAMDRMETIRKLINESKFILYETLSISITCSVGVAAFPKHGKTVNAVIKSADMALYQAKMEGRNKVVNAQSLSIK